MKSRIICVGNRLAGDDEAGPRVFDELAGRDRPAGVEVIEGGLAGLDLVARMEGMDRVVFVDAVSGFGRPGEVVVLSGRAELDSEDHFGHGAGLGFLLKAWPLALSGPAPQVMVVGIEGAADDDAPKQDAIARAATASLALAAGGE